MKVEQIEKIVEGYWYILMGLFGICFLIMIFDMNLSAMMLLYILVPNVIPFLILNIYWGSKMNEYVNENPGVIV